MNGAKRALLVAVMATTVIWAYEPPWGYIWERGRNCNFGTSIKDEGYPSGWVKYTRTDDEDLWWITTLLDTSSAGYWRYRFTTDNCPPSGYTYRISGYIGDPICERTIYLGPGGGRYDIQLHPAPGGEMTGLLIATAWATSPLLEEGWPFHLAGYCGLAGNSAQPFRGGYAYKPTPTYGRPESLRVFSWDGREIPPWPKGSLTTGNHFAPCLGDINGDGRLDIVYRGSIGSAGPCRIEAIDLQSGAYLPGWPLNRGGGKGWGPVNLWDMDGDGLPEVVAMEDTLIGDKRYVIAHIFDGDGSELPGWPVLFPGWLSFQTRPAVGDPDADGIGEVVLAAGDSVMMLDATGNVEPGWPFPLKQGLPPSWVEHGGSPRLVDLDLDGTQEIVIFTHLEDTSNTLFPFPDTTRVFVLNPTLTPRFSVSVE